jgi:hypothetical protein
MRPFSVIPTVAALAIAVVVAPLAAAEARRAQAPTGRSPDLWATINVCDTVAHPDTVGIRGSMPGLGPKRRSTVWMRFQVQYRSPADGRWRFVNPSADSGWKRLGATRVRVLESGHNFTFMRPPGGDTYTLRGLVSYRWRAKGRTVKRLKRVTTPGHRSTAGADPRNFSAATCELT